MRKVSIQAALYITDHNRRNKFQQNNTSHKQRTNQTQSTEHSIKTIPVSISKTEEEATTNCIQNRCKIKTKNREIATNIFSHQGKKINKNFEVTSRNTLMENSNDIYLFNHYEI